MYIYNNANVGGDASDNNVCRSLDIIVRPLVCSRNFIRLSHFPFQNVRLDRRVKRAHLEKSGVKSTADRSYRCYCRRVCSR